MDRYQAIVAPHNTNGAGTLSWIITAKTEANANFRATLIHHAAQVYRICPTCDRMIGTGNTSDCTGH